MWWVLQTTWGRTGARRMFLIYVFNISLMGTWELKLRSNFSAASGKTSVGNWLGREGMWRRGTGHNCSQELNQPRGGHSHTAAEFVISNIPTGRETSARWGRMPHPPLPNLFLVINIQKTTEYSVVKQKTKKTKGSQKHPTTLGNRCNLCLWREILMGFSTELTGWI